MPGCLHVQPCRCTWEHQAGARGHGGGVMDFSEPWAETFVEEDGEAGYAGLPVAVDVQHESATISSEGDTSSWEGESNAFVFENPQFLDEDGTRPSTSSRTEHPPIGDSLEEIREGGQSWFVPHPDSRL